MAIIEGQKLMVRVYPEVSKVTTREQQRSLKQWKPSTPALLSTYLFKMESVMETLQLEIKGTLYRLTTDQLIKIIELQIPGSKKEDASGKTRNALISHVITYVESDDLESLEDQGMAELLSLKDMMDKIQVTSEISSSATSTQNEDQEKLQRELEALKLALQQKESEMQALVNKEVDHTRDHNSPQKNITPAHLGSAPWRKEYKISGQIGEPGQKDRLTFSSLARQIENGLSKGYSDLEIVDAVIRAIVPGLQLRNYLEGKKDLTLPTLRRILRSHYQERSATELYKQLTTDAQGQKETPQNFLLRTMDLRQKILFASQEAESGLKYDPALVQSLFLHTVLTGLQSDSVKSDLQPYLLQTSTSDELLLEKLNVACANEKERQDKKRQNLPPRSTNVHVVQSSDGPDEKKCNSQQQITTPSPDLLTELKELRSNMVMLKDLKAEVAHIRESIQKPTQGPQQYQPAGREQDHTPAHHPMYVPPQYPPINREHENMPAYNHPSGPIQGHWTAQGPRPMRETTQFQQRFAPQRFYPAPRARPVCFNCRQNGVEYCQHCYNCGSSEHFRAGCRMYREPRPTRESLLNEERSLPRDRE